MLSADDLTPQQVARFLARVDASAGPESCWPWTGKPGEGGYGVFQVGRRPTRRTTSAHRVAFVIDGGTVEDYEVVRHGCDNPPCCNPSHLEVGSQSDNSRDMWERGRGQTPEQMRANQAAAAEVRSARWQAEELPRVLDELRGLDVPRTVANCERLIAGYSYARHRVGHTQLVAAAERAPL